jgi:hypothetical protein
MFGSKIIRSKVDPSYYPWTTYVAENENEYIGHDFGGDVIGYPKTEYEAIEWIE